MKRCRKTDKCKNASAQNTSVSITLSSLYRRVHSAGSDGRLSGRVCRSAICRHRQRGSCAVAADIADNCTPEDCAYPSQAESKQARRALHLPRLSNAASMPAQPLMRPASRSCCGQTCFINHDNARHHRATDIFCADPEGLLPGPFPSSIRIDHRPVQAAQDIVLPGAWPSASEALLDAGRGDPAVASVVAAGSCRGGGGKTTVNNGQRLHFSQPQNQRAAACTMCWLGCAPTSPISRAHALICKREDINHRRPALSKTQSQ